jgi:hypothetical protein
LGFTRGQQHQFNRISEGQMLQRPLHLKFTISFE